MSYKKVKVLQQLIDSRIDAFLNIELEAKTIIDANQKPFINIVNEALNLSQYDDKKLEDLTSVKNSTQIKDLKINEINKKVSDDSNSNVNRYMTSIRNNQTYRGTLFYLYETLRRSFSDDTLPGRKNRELAIKSFKEYENIRYKLHDYYSRIDEKITAFDYIGYFLEAKKDKKNKINIFDKKDNNMEIFVNIVDPNDSSLLNSINYTSDNEAKYNQIKVKTKKKDELLALYFNGNQSVLDIYERFYEQNVVNQFANIKSSIKGKMQDLDVKIAKQYEIYFKSIESVTENFDKINTSSESNETSRLINLLIKDMLQSTTDPYTFRRLYKELSQVSHDASIIGFNDIKIIPYSRENFVNGFNKLFIHKIKRSRNTPFGLNSRFGLIGEKETVKDSTKEIHCLEEIIYGKTQPSETEDTQRRSISIVNDVNIDTLADINNNLPPITYFLINDADIRMGKRSSLELSFFLKGLSTVELSKASPIFNMTLSLPAEISDQTFGTNYKTINFKNYLGYEENIIDINSSTKSDTNSVNMSFFTAPQTLNNFNENSKGRNSKLKNVTDYGITRLNRIDDITRPLMTVKSFTIDVAPTQGLMSFKTGKLSLVLHDKSRMIDVAALIKPDLLGVRENGAELDIEYGWSSPEAGNNNPIGTFLNSLRQKEKYIITNSSFNITQNGEVNIDLSLAMRGPIDIKSVKLTSGNMFKEEVAEVKAAYNNINTLKGALRYYTNKNASASETELTTFLEINEQIISTIYEKIFSLNPENSQLLSAVDSGNLNEYRTINNNIIKEIIKQFKLKEEAIVRKKLATALNNIPVSNEDIVKLFDFLRNAVSTSQITLSILIINAQINKDDPDNLEKPKNHDKLIKSLILSIYDFCVKVENVFKKSSEVIKKAEDYVEKLFVGIKEYDPFYDHEITNIINQFEKPKLLAFETHRTSISVDTYGNIKNSATNTSDNVDTTTDFVTLGNILTCLIGTQLRNTGGYTDIQIVSYTANDRAGMFSGKNLSSLLFKRSDLYDFTKDFFINNKEVTLEGFISRLIQEFALVKHNLCYFGTTNKKASYLTDSKEERDRLEKIYKHLKKRKLYTTEGRNVFVIPKIKLSFDTFSPKENKKATILRISIYDNNDNPYQDITTLMSSKRKEFFELTEKLARINAKDAVKSIDEATNQEIDKIFNELKSKDILTHDKTNKIIRINSKDLIPTKAIIKKHIPSATYGSHNSAIIDASITSINESRLNTVFLTRYDQAKKESKGVRVASNNQLPLRVMPASATITTFGCPIINFAQYMFLDFGTETTVDNIYAVTGIKHDLSPGKFTTSVTLTYGDIYGKYENAINQARRAVEAQPPSQSADASQSDDVDTVITQIKQEIAKVQSNTQEMRSKFLSGNYVAKINIDNVIYGSTSDIRTIDYMRKNLLSLALQEYNNAIDQEKKVYNVMITNFINSFPSSYNKTVKKPEGLNLGHNTLDFEILHDFHVFNNNILNFDNNYLHGIYVFSQGGATDTADAISLRLALRVSSVLRYDTTLNGNSRREFTFENIINRLFSHDKDKIADAKQKQRYDKITKLLKETFPPQEIKSKFKIESKKIEDSDNINEFIRKTIVNDLNNNETIKQISTLFEDKKKTESFGIVDMHVVIPSAVANNFNKLEYNLVVRKHKSKELTYDKATSIIKKHKKSSESSGPYTELSNSIKTRIKSLFSLNAKSPVNINGINGANAVTYNPQGKKIFIKRRTMHIVAADSLLKDSYIDDLILFAIGLNKAPQQQQLQLNLQTPARQTLTTTIVNNDNAQRITDNPLIELSQSFKQVNAKTRLSKERIYIYEMNADYFEELDVAIHFDTNIGIYEKILLAAYEWGGKKYKEHWSLGDDYMQNSLFIKDFIEKQKITTKTHPGSVKAYAKHIQEITEKIGAPYVIQKDIYNAINFTPDKMVQNIDPETIRALEKFVKLINKKTTIISGWRPPIYNQLNLNISGNRSKSNKKQNTYQYKTLNGLASILDSTYENKSVANNVIYYENDAKRQRNIFDYPPLGQGEYNAEYKAKYFNYTGLKFLYVNVFTEYPHLKALGVKSQDIFKFGIYDIYTANGEVNLRPTWGDIKRSDISTHKDNIDSINTESAWNKKAGIAHPYTSQHANGAAIDIMIDDIVTKQGHSATSKRVLINIVNKLKEAGFKYVKFYESTGHIHVDTKARSGKDFIFDGNNVLSTKYYNN